MVLYAGRVDHRELGMFLEDWFTRIIGERDDVVVDVSWKRGKTVRLLFTGEPFAKTMHVMERVDAANPLTGERRSVYRLVVRSPVHDVSDVFRVLRGLGIHVERVEETLVV